MPLLFLCVHPKLVPRETLEIAKKGIKIQVRESMSTKAALPSDHKELILKGTLRRLFRISNRGLLSMERGRRVEVEEEKLAMKS